VSLETIGAKMAPYAKRAEAALSKEMGLYSHSRFFAPITYALEGGKRVRPVILMLSAEALGCRNGKVLDAAVAVELLHTESIVHDDIIDEEITRRSRMTFHGKYGFNASLLTADFVFAMILAIAARYEDRRVAEELSNAALMMSEGEYSELTINPAAYDLTWDEYLKIVTQKTAALFQVSTKLGALIAGGKEKEVEAFSNYGRSLGIAYQLKDDLLDWRSKDKIATGLLRRHSESEIVGKMAALSRTYAEEAKRQLMLIPKSSATLFLEDLTEYTIQRGF
jgi:octaprenyl-diphosphate synthase